MVLDTVGSGLRLPVPMRFLSVLFREFDSARLFSPSLLILVVEKRLMAADEQSANWLF